MRVSHRRLVICVVAAVAACSVPAFAGEPYAFEARGSPGVVSGKERFRVSYLGENDSLGFVIAPNGLPYDRWFTTGTHLQFRWEKTASTFGFLPANARLLLTAGLAHDIYTPRNAEIESIAELDGDRPYSGWLAAQLGAEVVLDSSPLALVRTGRAWTHFTLDGSVGALGPWSLAGPIQYHAHFEYLRFQGKPMPPVKGWGVAETAPGIVADVSAFADTSLIAAAWSAPSALAWTGSRPQLHLRLGARADAGLFQVAAGPNVTLLAGWMSDALSPEDVRVPVALYLYARGDLRFVAWNASIDRELLDGTVAARSAPLVSEVAAGLVLRVWMLEVSWSHAFRTNETATLPAELRTGQLLWHWTAAVIW